jgi:uncharacterized protein (DUF983 family)
MFAPRAREDSVRPRRLSGAPGRPLNFTVRPRVDSSSVLSRCCPECGAPQVQPLRNGFGFGRPTHHCGACGTDLRATLTAKALWCVPIAVVSVAAAVLSSRLLTEFQIQGALRAAITGAVGALAVGLPLGALARGFVFRKWQS